MDDGVYSFYGLTAQPFAPLHDLTGLIELESRRDLIDEVMDEIKSERTITTIGGERGVGKTILLRQLAAALRQQNRLVVLVSAEANGPVDVQRSIDAALGTNLAEAVGPYQLIKALEHRGSIVLLLDDAERLSEETLQFCWLLIRLLDFGTTTLHLVLIGGLGRWAALEHRELIELRQRAGWRAIMKPLEDEEAALYLEMRIQAAGQSLRRVLSPGAAAELIEQAFGLPGQINALAEVALAHGYRTQSRPLSRRAVRQALFNEPDLQDPQALPPARSYKHYWRAALAGTVAIGGVAASLTFIDVGDVPRRALAAWVGDQPRLATAQDPASGPRTPGRRSIDRFAIDQGRTPDQTLQTSPMRPPYAAPQPAPSALAMLMPPPTLSGPVAPSISPIAPSMKGDPAGAAEPEVESPAPAGDPAPAQPPKGVEAEPAAPLALPAPTTMAAQAPAPPPPPQAVPAPLTSAAPPSIDPPPPDPPSPSAPPRDALTAAPPVPAPPSTPDNTPVDEADGAGLPDPAPPAAAPPNRSPQQAPSPALTAADPQPAPAPASAPAPEAPPRPPAQTASNPVPVPPLPPEIPAIITPLPAVAAPPKPRSNPGLALARRHGGPGLALLVEAGDTMPALYARVYQGVTPPPYDEVASINRVPLRPGAIVVFPEPPGGWNQR